MQIKFQLDLLSKFIITLSRDNLARLGLINHNGLLKSTLLRHYFANYQTEALKIIFPDLTPIELKILTYIIENKEKNTSLDKIADILLIGDDKYSLWALYKLISRIKPKVKNSFRIINTRGKGYRIEKI